MPFHVPGSECAADEFLAPSGEWFSTLRAITFDNWLVWKHALPEELHLRRQLTAEVFQNIQALARRIHEVHVAMHEYRRLTDCPFTVTRWWDPQGEEPWRSGKRVLLRHRALSAKEFLRFRSSRSTLQAQIVSQHWMELELKPDLEAGAHPTWNAAPPGPRSPDP